MYSKAKVVKDLRLAQWAESIIQARYLVGSLGEDAEKAWWDCAATSATGRSMLANMFPRTVLSASLETVTRAASAVHDLHIGRRGAYHLYRLPIAEENALQDLSRSAGCDTRIQAIADLRNRDARMAYLAVLAGDERIMDAFGPMQCGSPAGLRRGKTLQRMCAVYLAAFESERIAYPYLADPVAM